MINSRGRYIQGIYRKQDAPTTVYRNIGISESSYETYTWPNIKCFSINSSTFRRSIFLRSIPQQNAVVMRSIISINAESYRIRIIGILGTGMQGLTLRYNIVRVNFLLNVLIIEKYP